MSGSIARITEPFGAFFAVYWLARIGIDGAEGFSYGVDADWKPRDGPADESESGGFIK